MDNTNTLKVIKNINSLENNLKKIYNIQSGKGWHFNKTQISYNYKNNLYYIIGSLNINTECYFYIKPIKDEIGIFFGRFKTDKTHDSKYYCAVPILNRDSSIYYIFIMGKKLDNTSYIYSYLIKLLSENICQIDGPYRYKPPI